MKLLTPYFVLTPYFASLSNKAAFYNESYLTNRTSAGIIIITTRATSVTGDTSAYDCPEVEFKVQIICNFNKSCTDVTIMKCGRMS